MTVDGKMDISKHNYFHCHYHNPHIVCQMGGTRMKFVDNLWIQVVSDKLDNPFCHKGDID